MKVSDLISLYEPNPDAYGTHTNLLKSLGPEVKTVLELGCGMNSTRLFLNRSFFPILEQLTTIEHKEDWAAAMTVDDPRHKVIVVPEPIEPFLDAIDLEEFDLIFVDNSDSGERRQDSLRYISEHVGRSLVVAHDFEAPGYRAAALTGFRHFIEDDRQQPHTALLWR